MRKIKNNKDNHLDVSVIGLGYIGLPTASILSLSGFNVFGFDKDKLKVKILQDKQLQDMDEPGLLTIFTAAINSGKFKVCETLSKADTYIIAVPTPDTKNKKADLSHLKSAAEEVSKVIKKGDLVIVESTIPPGTCDGLVKKTLEQSGLKVGKDLYLAHCPERVLPGNLLSELVNNDRIIGGINEESAKRAEVIYSKFCRGKIYLTNLKTAELVKLVENSYRDVNIAFANELSKICSKLEIESSDVINLANKHPRVNILNPGPGVGGHCISVDPWFIVEKFPEDTTIIKSARLINDKQPDFILKMCLKMLKNVKNPKISVLGLSYKGNIGDFRNSPAIRFLDLCKKNKVKYSIYDPHVKFSTYELSSLEETLKGSDLVLIMTDHNEFKFISPKYVKKHLKNKNIIDCRNILNKSDWIEEGFKFYRI